MHLTPPHVIARIIELTRRGETSRRIRDLTGVAKNTIMKYQKLANADEILCPCGKSVKHRGWCSERFKKSLARLAFMDRWHHRTPKPEIDENCVTH